MVWLRIDAVIFEANEKVGIQIFADLSNSAIIQPSSYIIHDPIKTSY